MVKAKRILTIIAIVLGLGFFTFGFNILEENHKSKDIFIDRLNDILSGNYFEKIEDVLPYDKNLHLSFKGNSSIKDLNFNYVKMLLSDNEDTMYFSEYNLIDDFNHTYDVDFSINFDALRNDKGYIKTKLNNLLKKYFNGIITDNIKYNEDVKIGKLKLDYSFDSIEVFASSHDFYILLKDILELFNNEKLLITSSGDFKKINDLLSDKIKLSSFDNNYVIKMYLLDNEYVGFSVSDIDGKFDFTFCNYIKKDHRNGYVNIFFDKTKYLECTFIQNDDGTLKVNGKYMDYFNFESLINHSEDFTSIELNVDSYNVFILKSEIFINKNDDYDYSITYKMFNEDGVLEDEIIIDANVIDEFPPYDKGNVNIIDFHNIEEAVMFN